MPTTPASDTPAPPEPAGFARWAGSWKAILALILGLLALRVVYLVWLCPFPLIEDEAQYWEWSRRLGWSYYSKGPGIAWAIALATGLFGDTAWAVRLVPVVASALASLGVAGLACDIFRDRRAGFFAAACLNLAFIVLSTSLLATIDSAYMACWSLAAWAGWRAMACGSRWAWLWLGLFGGLGFLFKYTLVLLAPGLVVFAVLRRRSRPTGDAAGPSALPWVLGCLALFALSIVPVAVWNSQNEWSTVRHLLGHLRVEGGDVPAVQGVNGWNYSPLWTLGYIGTQLGLGGPMLVLAGLAWRRARLGRAAHPAIFSGALYLVLCAAPILLFYLAVSFATKPQGNWAGGAFVTLAALAGAEVVRGMTEFVAVVAAWRLEPGRPRRGWLTRRPDTAPQVAWHATLVAGIIGAVVIARMDLLAGVPIVGPVVPIHRLLGADEQARHVQRLLDALRVSTGKEPFVVAQHYGPAAQMAFYLSGHPTVYCSASRMGGRKNQYDFWSQTDLEDPALRGRPAVMIGASQEQWGAAFDSVETVGRLEGDRRPERNDRTAFTGIGFRGFPPQKGG